MIEYSLHNGRSFSSALEFWGKVNDLVGDDLIDVWIEDLNLTESMAHKLFSSRLFPEYVIKTQIKELEEFINSQKTKENLKGIYSAILYDYLQGVESQKEIYQCNDSINYESWEQSYLDSILLLQQACANNEKYPLVKCMTNYEYDLRDFYYKNWQKAVEPCEQRAHNSTKIILGIFDTNTLLPFSNTAPPGKDSVKNYIDNILRKNR